VLQTSPRELR